jgi:hypothetical protein
MPVFLIAKTAPTWPVWFSYSRQAIGRSVTAGLDRMSRADRGDPPGLKDWIIMLGEFEHEHSNPNYDVDNPGHLAHHVILTFLTVIKKDQTFEIHSGDISWIDSESVIEADMRALIGTANLARWVSFIVDTCNEKMSLSTRRLGNEIYQALEKEGLHSCVTILYRKIDNGDGTFTFRNKREPAVGVLSRRD